MQLKTLFEEGIAIYQKMQNARYGNIVRGQDKDFQKLCNLVSIYLEYDLDGLHTGLANIKRGLDSDSNFRKIKKIVDLFLVLTKFTRNEIDVAQAVISLQMHAHEVKKTCVGRSGNLETFAVDYEKLAQKSSFFLNQNNTEPTANVLLSSVIDEQLRSSTLEDEITSKETNLNNSYSQLEALINLQDKKEQSIASMRQQIKQAEDQFHRAKKVAGNDKDCADFELVPSVQSAVSIKLRENISSLEKEKTELETQRQLASQKIRDQVLAIDNLTKEKKEQDKKLDAAVMQLQQVSLQKQTISSQNLRLQTAVNELETSKRKIEADKNRANELLKTKVNDFEKLRVQKVEQDARLYEANQMIKNLITEQEGLIEQSKQLIKTLKQAEQKAEVSAAEKATLSRVNFLVKPHHLEELLGVNVKKIIEIRRSEKSYDEKYKQLLKNDEKSGHPWAHEMYRRYKDAYQFIFSDRDREFNLAKEDGIKLRCEVDLLKMISSIRQYYQWATFNKSLQLQKLTVCTEAEKNAVEETDAKTKLKKAVIDFAEETVKRASNIKDGKVREWEKKLGPIMRQNLPAIDHLVEEEIAKELRSNSTMALASTFTI